MGWRDAKASFGRVAIAFASAGLVGGCFQPLYGSGTFAGSTNVRDALSTVAVEQIDAAPGSYDVKAAVQIRNDLIFNFTGGGSPSPPAYRLKVRMVGTRAIVIVDKGSALPNAENYNLSANYTLTDAATGAVVINGRAAATVSYDPSGQQRFARISALHEAEQRAARTITDSITTRLASYFISGS
jgi:LPS-assembly lipoprotein